MHSFTKLTLLLLLLSITLAHAQVATLKGTVKSESANKAIPFVNIGIKQKGIGTAADSEGRFILKLPDEFLQDTLTFSAVGYKELSLPVKSVLASGRHDYLLQEKVNALQEVQVLSKKSKIRALGVKYKMPFIVGTAQTTGSDDIMELAQLINTGGKSTELLSTSIYLQSTKADSATFRINFYANENGQPAKRIIEKSIIKRLPLKTGWVTVNLEPYSIFMEDDFFIGYEYLPDSRDAEKFLFFYGCVFGGNIFTRKVSLDKWEKEPGGRISTYVTVRQ